MTIVSLPGKKKTVYLFTGKTQNRRERQREREAFSPALSLTL
jgi:hypothetical protein